MKLVFSAEAFNDLELIGDWIAKENPARAVTFVRELRAACSTLTEFPESCPFVPRYETRNVRRKVHGNYLIFYCIASAEIQIIHILHGAQDYESVLFP